MLRPSFLRRALAVGTFLAGSLGLSRAEAQPTLTVTGVRHHQSSFEGKTLPVTQINRKDCDEDDYYTFTIHLSAISGVSYSYEVWESEDAGTDCSEDAAQNDSCRQVAATTTDTTIRVYVRDIVSDTRGSWTGGVMSDPNACVGSSEAPQSSVLHFLTTDNGTMPGPSVNYDVIMFDLVGPGPPGSVKAGIGENALVATWKESSNATQVAEYRVYAEPVSAPMGEGGAAGAGMAGAGMAGTGMAGAGAAGAGTAGDAGAAGVAGAGAGTGGASGEVTGCTSSVLTPGEPVSADVKSKGEATPSSTKAEAKGLTNGVRYALGVASIDAFNNPGDLSSLDCATPEPVTGFYEAYREAGGEAGGGYCALGASPSRVLAGGVALAALGLILRRLRTRPARKSQRGTS